MPPASPVIAHKRPIALVGMMGAGKTVVGRRLASRLGWPFHDSDAQVEREAGCTVAALFPREGEAAFRERERKAVAALLSRVPIVLATGGGAMADPQTRSLLLERSETVWLDAEPAILARRLAEARDRPLLNGADREDTLTRLLAKRRPCYREAAHHIQTTGKNPDDVADALLKLLNP